MCLIFLVESADQIRRTPKVCPFLFLFSRHLSVPRFFLYFLAASLRRNHFEEEELQEDEEDRVNILEEERQHWCEVERACDQVEEVF